MTCFVYLIGQRHGPVKIGFSGDPEKRRRSLQCGSFFRLAVLYRLPVPNWWRGYGIEQAVLSAFAHRRLNGEWLNLDLEEGIDAIDMVVSTEAHFRERARAEGLEWRS